MASRGSGSASGPSTGLELGYWEPKEPFTEAVCCMEGMDCWSGSFANDAYRGQLESDLAKFEMDLERSKVVYDELNADNLRR